MLGVGLALTLAAALCWPAAMQNASASGEKRTLSLFNIHTKESLTVTFKKDGRYDRTLLSSSTISCATGDATNRARWIPS